MKTLVRLLAAIVPVSYGLSHGLRSAWFYLVAILMIGAILVKGAAKGREARAFLAAAFLALVSGLAVSASSLNPHGNRITTLYLLVAWGVAPLVLIRVMKRDLVGVATAFVLGQTVSSLAGIFQGFTGRSVLGIGLTNGRAPGFAGHTNILGLMASVAVLLCLDQALARRGLSRGLIVVSALNLLAVLVCGSITSFIALIAGGVVLLAVRRVRVAPVLGGIVILFISFFIVSSVASSTGSLRSPLQRLAQTSGETGEVSTFQIREYTWKYAWHRVERDPWHGVGLDDASGVTFDGVTLTHDLPLRAWFQGGPALLLAVLLVFVSCLRRIGFALRRRAAPAAAGVVMTMLAFSLFNASFEQAYFWFTLVAGWAVLQPAWSEARDQRKLAREEAKRGSLALPAPRRHVAPTGAARTVTR